MQFIAFRCIYVNIMNVTLAVIERDENKADLKMSIIFCIRINQKFSKE